MINSSFPYLAEVILCIDSIKLFNPLEFHEDDMLISRIVGCHVSSTQESMVISLDEWMTGDVLIRLPVVPP